MAELCREHGMSNASFYKWRAKYGGMDAFLMHQMKSMEDSSRGNHGTTNAFTVSTACWN